MGSYVANRKYSVPSGTGLSTHVQWKCGFKFRGRPGIPSKSQYKFMFICSLSPLSRKTLWLVGPLARSAIDTVSVPLLHLYKATLEN